MAGRSFSTMDYFSARCADMKPLFAFDASNVLEARSWRTRALAKVRDLLGEMPEAVPLNAETIERVELDGYAREKVVFDSDAHSSVPAYVLIPSSRDGPLPAVICVHGHGPGKDVVVGVTDPDPHYTEENKTLAIRQQNYDYGRQLAKHGFVTIAIDLRGFGERTDEPAQDSGREPCYAQFICGILLGIYPLSLNIHDIIRAVDYLETRREVDPQLIGCAGLCLGAAMTLWAAAVEKRIRAAVVSGYLCEYETFGERMGTVCGSEVIPALYRYFDMCDIASLIAPRPLLIQSGLHDDKSPVESARKSFVRLRRAYEAWGQPDAVKHDIFPGGHEFHSETAFAFFDKTLVRRP